MAQEPVSLYQLYWNVRTGQGRIVLVLGEIPLQREVKLENIGPEEFAAVSDLLRNERPIFWDPQTAEIATGYEPVGEGEGFEP
ncbi:MAG: hypothetical protein SNJ74_01150 [Fimbriimonadaceae bacterium]